jgi:uncharacterized damage-inducible protein DinB
MTMRLRHAFAAAATVLTLATPAVAQQPTAAPQRAGLMGDLIRDVAEVEKKLTSLAKEIPEEKQGWRPATGVRSVGEVWMHVAADNYLIPSSVGVAPSAASGIVAADYSTVTKYEQRKLSRDAALAEMTASFAHLRQAMMSTPDAKLDDRVKFFGQDMSVRQVWMATAMHLHEHLGQAIAYARTNHVTPPWSRQGG